MSFKILNIGLSLIPLNVIEETVGSLHGDYISFFSGSPIGKKTVMYKLLAPVSSLDHILIERSRFALIAILDKSRFNYVPVYPRLAASRREKIFRSSF